MKHDLQYQASTDRGHVCYVYYADCKYRKMGTEESLYSDLNGTDSRSDYRKCRIMLNCIQIWFINNYSEYSLRNRVQNYCLMKEISIKLMEKWILNWLSAASSIHVGSGVCEYVCARSTVANSTSYGCVGYSRITVGRLFGTPLCTELHQICNCT
jgi:hypothetical protein